MGLVPGLGESLVACKMAVAVAALYGEEREDVLVAHINERSDADLVGYALANTVHTCTYIPESGSDIGLLRCGALEQATPVSLSSTPIVIE